MNIDKERAAFEATVLGGKVFAAIKWNGSKYTFHDGGNCMTQDMFDVWLKAKEHAAVMALPLAEVRKRKDHHQWAVYVPESLTAVAFDFPHREDAIAWAVQRGYRVAQP